MLANGTSERPQKPSRFSTVNRRRGPLRFSQGTILGLRDVPVHQASFKGSKHATEYSMAKLTWVNNLLTLRS